MLSWCAGTQCAPALGEPGQHNCIHALYVSPGSLLQGPGESSCTISCRGGAGQSHHCMEESEVEKKILLRKDFSKKQGKMMSFLSLINTDFGILHPGNPGCQDPKPAPLLGNHSGQQGAWINAASTQKRGIWPILLSCCSLFRKYTKVHGTLLWEERFRKF